MNDIFESMYHGCIKKTLTELQINCCSMQKKMFWFSLFKGQVTQQDNLQTSCEKPKKNKTLKFHKSPVLIFPSRDVSKLPNKEITTKLAMGNLSSTNIGLTFMVMYGTNQEVVTHELDDNTYSSRCEISG